MQLEELGELGGRRRAGGAVGLANGVEVRGQRLPGRGHAVQRRAEAGPRGRRGRAVAQPGLGALARRSEPAGAEDAKRGARVRAQQRVAQQREQQRVGAARRNAVAQRVEAVAGQPDDVVLRLQQRRGLRRLIGDQRAGERCDERLEHGPGERRFELEPERARGTECLLQTRERSGVGHREREAARAVLERHRAHRDRGGEHGAEVHAGRDVRYGVQRRAPGGREREEQPRHRGVEVCRIEQPPLPERRDRQHAIRLAAEPQRRERAGRRHVREEVPARRGDRVVGELAGELVEHVAPRHRPQGDTHLPFPSDCRSAGAGGVGERVDGDPERPCEQRAVCPAGGERGAALVAQAHGGIVARGAPRRPHGRGVVRRRARAA